jgi:hypothetical protein
MIVAGVEITKERIDDIINRIRNDIRSITELEVWIALFWIGLFDNSPKEIHIIVPKSAIKWHKLQQLKKKYKGIKFL